MRTAPHTKGNWQVLHLPPLLATPLLSRANFCNCRRWVIGALRTGITCGCNWSCSMGLIVHQGLCRIRHCCPATVVGPVCCGYLRTKAGLQACVLNLVGWNRVCLYLGVSWVCLSLSVSCNRGAPSHDFQLVNVPTDCHFATVFNPEWLGWCILPYCLLCALCCAGHQALYNSIMPDSLPSCLLYLLFVWAIVWACPLCVPH